MKYFFTLAALAAITDAHTIFLQLAANGVTNPIGYAIRTPTYDGPINDVTSQYIACNGGPNPTTPSSGIINVKAGDTVRAVWRHTLESGPSDVVDPSHKGPTQAYMKKVTDATTDVGYGGGWFKIQEEGLIKGGNGALAQTWSVDRIIANGGYQDIKIPSCIANGQYLLRAELIALHAANGPGGAQFYQECAQINVTGGTGTATPATVSLPGAYSASDPGILFNLYQNVNSYTIPGPRPMNCGGTQPTTSAGPVTTAATTKATTLTTMTTSKAAVTTSAGPGSCTVAKFAQCGGNTYTGCTTCAAGSTCQAVSAPYYSQCL